MQESARCRNGDRAVLTNELVHVRVLELRIAEFEVVAKGHQHVRRPVHQTAGLQVSDEEDEPEPEHDSQAGTLSARTRLSAMNTIVSARRTATRAS